MRTVLIRSALGALLAIPGLTACGDSSESGGGPDIVVTTSILGDVVRNLVGPEVAVEVLMPPGSDPHDFAPTPKQAAATRTASVVVINGLGFEAGLDDLVESAVDDGAVVIDTSVGVRSRLDDPHFFTDPVAMAEAVDVLAERLVAEVDELDGPAVRARTSDYLADLEQLDRDIAATLAPVPAERRILVTNHDVFGAFAARYGFEVLGTVLPGGSTLAEPSAADLAELAAQIQRAGVPAVFAETSAPSRLATALAGEGTDVDVVELYSEALGPSGSDAATYLDMMRTNATRIAGALA